jgi:hypothetical protein
MFINGDGANIVLVLFTRTTADGAAEHVGVLRIQETNSTDTISKAPTISFLMLYLPLCGSLNRVAAFRFDVFNG